MNVIFTLIGLRSLSKICVVCGICVKLIATPTQAEAQQIERAKPAPVMEKLAKGLAGEWRGTSWAITATGRRRIDSWEKVDSKLDGLALFVHGRHTSLEKEDSGRVVHEAVAMLYYDLAAKRLRLIPMTMDGRTVETDVTETEKGYIWGFALPNNVGRVRYTVDLSQPDTWIETGEFSRDGTTWMPTLALNLKRVH